MHETAWLPAATTILPPVSSLRRSWDARAGDRAADRGATAFGDFGPSGVATDQGGFQACADLAQRRWN